MLKYRVCARARHGADQNLNVNDVSVDDERFPSADRTRAKVRESAVQRFDRKSR